MIKAPRAAGEYSLRNHDCRKAMELPANVVLRDSCAPFIDFSSLLHAILPEATAAGWDEKEVEMALEHIVKDLRPVYTLTVHPSEPTPVRRPPHPGSP